MVRRSANDGRLYTYTIDLKLKRSPYDNDVSARSCLCMGYSPRDQGRMFVIEDVHIIKCSKLFKGLDCAVLSMVLFTIKNP